MSQKFGIEWMNVSFIKNPHGTFNNYCVLSYNIFVVKHVLNMIYEWDLGV